MKLTDPNLSPSMDQQIDAAKDLIRTVRQQTLVKLNHIVRAIMFKHGISETSDALDTNFRFSLETNSPDIQRVFFRDEHVLDVDWVECEIYPTTKEMEEFVKLLGENRG